MKLLNEEVKKVYQEAASSMRGGFVNRTEG
jgi:hypothetical protein